MKDSRGCLFLHPSEKGTLEHTLAARRQLESTAASAKRDPEKPLRVTDHICENISIQLKIAIWGMFVFRIPHIKIAISQAGNEQSTPVLLGYPPKKTKPFLPT